MRLAEPPEPPPLREFYLWPENLSCWAFFLDCQTQWRQGAEGCTGLAWEGVQVRMDRLVPRKRHRRFWDLLEAMERGALRGWREAREEREQRRG